MGYSVDKDLKSTFMHALPVAFVAGIVAYLLGALMQGFAAQVWGQVILSLIVIAALVGLKKTAKIDNLSLYDAIVLFAAITIVGSILTMFFAAAAPFILSINNAITVSGLLFTFLYIAIAETVLSKWL